MATLVGCVRHLALNTIKTCAVKTRWQNVCIKETRRNFSRISAALLSGNILSIIGINSQGPSAGAVVLAQ